MKNSKEITADNLRRVADLMDNPPLEKTANKKTLEILRFIKDTNRGLV